CAYRRAARAARLPDLMDKPSLQTASTNKLVRARAATPARNLCPLSTLPTRQDGCTSVGEGRCLGSRSQTSALDCPELIPPGQLTYLVNSGSPSFRFVPII